MPSGAAFSTSEGIYHTTVCICVRVRHAHTNHPAKLNDDTCLMRFRRRAVIRGNALVMTAQERNRVFFFLPPLLDTNWMSVFLFLP